MAGFFELVGHQIDEVERIQQRCAQRVKRFTAFGTMEQSRGVARQLNDAIGAARALLKSSFTDSRLDIDALLARHAVSHRLTSNGSIRLRPNSFTTHRGDTKSLVDGATKTSNAHRPRAFKQLLERNIEVVDQSPQVGQQVRA